MIAFRRRLLLVLLLLQALVTGFITGQSYQRTECLNDSRETISALQKCSSLAVFLEQCIDHPEVSP